MSRCALPFVALAFAAAATCAFAADNDWAIYGGTSDGTRHSSLTQITKGNVSQLAPAWTHSMEAGGDPQTHPLAIGGVVYAYTPSLKVIALDGATGKQIWLFDSGVAGRGAQRGMTWWHEGREKRLFTSVILYALDPLTGKTIAAFGDNGRIDLSQNLGRDASNLYISLTTPGVIYKDTIITGFRTAESGPAAPGDIRAFDVRTGKLRWAFHTIPHPGEAGYDTWPPDAWRKAGGANNWAGMVVDHKRGIVYAPTGSAVDEFYGADRAGGNLFAILVFTLVMGAAQGVITIVRGAVPLALFGAEGYSTVLGLIATPVVVVNATSPTIFALIVDHWGWRAGELVLLVTCAASWIAMELMSRWYERARRL